MKLRENEVVWQELDGETVVLDLRSSTYLKLNGSGAVLWNLLRQDITRQGLVDALVSRYGIDEKRASLDVDAFVESLEQRKFLDP